MDMSSIFGKVKELQENMKEAQDKIAELRAEGESGGGIVKATVNGKKQVLKIEIDPDIISKDDKEMIEDLSAAAVNKALENIDVKIQEEMKKVTGNLPNIPGFKFPGM
ncbi:YbaB/EbfC family nucleoid-associated protein [Hyphobacterium sp. CCMP332]|nr:YbaB/EbfC family nucleoid-associated protein [Hyphobacterium sp. CCMP332]